MPLDLKVGDILQLKKPHACGANAWIVFRVGADLGLRCEGCQRTMMLPRHKVEKRVRRIERDGQAFKPHQPG